MRLKLYEKPYFTLSVANVNYKVRPEAQAAMLAHKRYRKRFPSKGLADAAASAIASDIGHDVAVGEVFGGLGF